MAKPQWQCIADALREKIESGAFQPGDRIPGEEQLATDWKVSRPTAHRAVRELQMAGLVTRQRRWGTVVADRAKGSTGRVGLVIDHMATNYNFPQADVMQGIHDVFGEDVMLICCDSRSDPDREAHNLRKMQSEVDGILCYPISDPKNTPLMRKLAASRTPLVLLDRVPKGLEIDAVVSDNFEATHHAIQTLLDRGHERIGFISFSKPEISTVGERFAGYERALVDSGLSSVRPYVRWFERHMEHDALLLVQAVHDAMFTLVKQDKPVTAVFCVQDGIAMAVLDACEQLGIRLPEDIELATFNDWPPMMLRRPWQTHRIVQSTREMGRVAATALKARIDGSNEPPHIHRVSADFFVADAGLRPQSATNASRPARSDRALT